MRPAVAVVVAFFICWAPFHAQRLIAIFGSSHASSGNVAKEDLPFIHQLYGISTYVSGVLYYLSTTINPILYHIMSLKFRNAFKVCMMILKRSSTGTSDWCIIWSVKRETSYDNSVVPDRMIGFRFNSSYSLTFIRATGRKRLTRAERGSFDPEFMNKINQTTSVANILFCFFFFYANGVINILLDILSLFQHVIIPVLGRVTRRSTFKGDCSVFQKRVPNF